MSILKKLKSAYVIGATMIAMGICLNVGPLNSIGAISKLDDLYNLSVQRFGALLIFGGLITFVNKLPVWAFIIATLPFMMYIAASAAYILENPAINPAGLCIYAAFYVLTAREYFSDRGAGGRT